MRTQVGISSTLVRAVFTTALLDLGGYPTAEIRETAQSSGEDWNSLGSGLRLNPPSGDFEVALFGFKAEGLTQPLAVSKAPEHENS